MTTTPQAVIHDRVVRAPERAVFQGWPTVSGSEDESLRRRVNVGSMERMISLLGGGALSAYGLSRKSALGGALAAVGGFLLYRGATGQCALYRSLGVNTAVEGQAEPVDYYERGIHVSASTTINMSQKALYEYWRDFVNLPRIMSHLHAVEVLDERRSHWIAKGPMGSWIEWDAELINDEPYEVIAWRSLADAEVHNVGSVRFTPAPGGRGTEVRVTIEYIPPAGRLGAAVAGLLGESPIQQVRDDLRRFKQVMEAGEVPTTQGQPHGQCLASASSAYE